MRKRRKTFDITTQLPCFHVFMVGYKVNEITFLAKTFFLCITVFYSRKRIYLPIIKYRISCMNCVTHRQQDLIPFLFFDSYLKVKLWLLLYAFNQPKHIFVNLIFNNLIEFWFMNGQSAISYNANNIWWNVERENMVTWNVNVCCWTRKL